ncbi:hypothetical protein [Tellurirhabdus bombi]|uniref:hypothetical protein n=1 Tax=Tellurirhabdus bombi TaxID=2907205 RepID=UPI001F48F8E8|nr:hypothetical protein [Tellurirhabdus bombi]
MKRKQPATGPKAAARLIEWSISQLMGNAGLRRELNLSLYDLEQAASVRRKLLRQFNQESTPSQKPRNRGN